MANITTTGSGNWSSTTPDAPWPSGTVPSDNDVITIANTHTVTINADTTHTTITLGADGGSGTDALIINAGGKLEITYQIDADQIIYLRGDAEISGTIEIGTVANPIPATRKVTLAIKDGADGDYGFKFNAGSTVTIQGSNPWGTSITDPDRTFLASNAAANATSLTVADTTDWKDNDIIGVASTTRTYSECEGGTLNGAASGTTLTVDGFGGTGGGVAYAHSGTSPTRAEIVNLSRNITLQGESSSLMSYVTFETTAVVNIDWTAFFYMDNVTIKTTTGSLDLNRCSFYYFEDSGIAANGSAHNNWTLQNCVAFRLADLTLSNGIYVPATTGTSWVIDNCVVILCGLGGTVNSLGAKFDDVEGTVSDLTIVGAKGAGITMTQALTIGATLPFTGLVVHSCASFGMLFTTSNYYDSIIPAFTVWHNTTGGATFNMSTNGCTFAGITAFGNNSYSIGGYGFNFTTFNNLALGGFSGFATAYGFNCGTTNCRFNSCSFGTPVTHSTSDFDLKYVQNCHFYNCTLASTEFSIDTMASQSSAMFTMHDTTAGISGFLTQTMGGQITADTTYYNTSSPSQKLTPRSASVKLLSGIKRVKVASGTSVTISCYVRKSTVAAGGALYNGNEPRLQVKENLYGGISAATVDTAAAAAGDWEQLTGSVGPVSVDTELEFYVDCDGTAGFVNVDDWTVSGDSKTKIWFEGLPNNWIESSSSGGGGPLTTGRIIQ